MLLQIKRNWMIKSIFLLLIPIFMSGCGGAYFYQVSRVFEPGHSEIRRLVNRPDPYNYAYLLDVKKTVHSRLIIRGIAKGKSKYNITPVGINNWIEVGNKEITELPPGEYYVRLWSPTRATMSNEHITAYGIPIRPKVKVQLEPNKFYYIALQKNSEYVTKRVVLYTEWVVLYEVNRNRFRISDDGTAIEDIGENDPDFRISSEEPLTIIKSYPPHVRVKN